MSAVPEIVTLDFCDFHPKFCKTYNYFYNLLSQRFRLALCEKPDFVIYSHEGYQHQLHRGVKIFYTVESFRPNFRECDYAFTHFNLDDPRNLRLPNYVMYGKPESLLKDQLDLEKVLAAKTRFCSFVVSNPNLKKTRRRLEFFQKLSKYKQVDSAGRVMNNVGFTLEESSAKKVEFLRSCKFNIAFENKSLPGYTTEKIFEAMQAFCLPIYWGNPEIHREFNPRSFLNYFDYPNDEALIAKIIELDQDDAKYMEYLRQPYFQANQPNEYFSEERVLQQFEKIFSTPITPVSRRRFFSFPGRWVLVRRNKF
jgi:alpha(1,3/1,4) fucosyltransferase